MTKLCTPLFGDSIMYHSAGRWNTQRILGVISAVALSGLSFMPAYADATRLTTAQNCKTKNLGLISRSFDLLPAGKKLRKSPEDVFIYEYNETPLGNRQPLLLVHGLRGEFYPYFRWQKVAEHFKSNSDFDKNYKIYLCRYPTLVRLEKVTPKFAAAVHKLYSACNNKPITCVALSMGGNLIYESMLDPSVEPEIASVIALGTPFHGSPLFSANWMQYSIYKRLSMPWTRIDHSLALKLYFDNNKNLLQDLSWDDSDNAIPDVGKFRSKLPFGPKGVLTYQDTVNTRLREINEKHRRVKSKFITYGGYLHNPYEGPTSLRYIENIAFYPIALCTVKLPAHFAREHPALRMLNRDIAAVDVRKEWKENGKSPFLYTLNDGITPLSSALFLPEDLLKKTALVSEHELPRLCGKTDVKLARVFGNIDHLTYIDGYRPLTELTKMKDELNPELQEKDIFSWMLDDVLSLRKESVADEEPKLSEDEASSDRLISDDRHE